MATVTVLHCREVGGSATRLAGMRGGSSGHAGPVFCRRGGISGSLRVAVLKVSFLGEGLWNTDVCPRRI